MILAVRIFQLLHVCAILGNIVWNRLPKKDDGWHYLRIAQWVYYICGVYCVVFPFGIIGVLEEDIMSGDNLFIGILFACACIVSTIIMIIQKIWKIQYNSDILIFRNSFGIKYRYKLNELVEFEGKRLCGLQHNGKKVIQWDSLIMNSLEEISLGRVLRGKKPFV